MSVQPANEISGVVIDELVRQWLDDAYTNGIGNFKTYRSNVMNLEHRRLRYS